MPKGFAFGIVSSRDSIGMSKTVVEVVQWVTNYRSVDLVVARNESSHVSPFQLHLFNPMGLLLSSSIFLLLDLCSI